jgi:TolA-binding protein
MSQINLKIFRTCVLLVMVIAVVLFLPSSDTYIYGAEKKEIPAKKQPETDSYIMEMEFIGNRPDTRIARTDDSEIMIAFKMKAQGDFFRFGQGRQKFAEIRYEKLPGGAEAVFLKTRDIIDTYETKWLEEGKTLQISVTTRKKKALEQSLEKPQLLTEKKNVNQQSTDAEFVRSIKELPCFSGGELNSAYAAVSNENWESASEIIDEYIADNGPDGKCSDGAAFLKAYIFYRTRGKEDSAEARRLFQEAMTEFPDSKYLPYSALFLGEIELSLTGYASAAGYFGYILNEFPDFLAKPEAIYGFALANVQLDNLVVAYKSLMDLASNYPESQYNNNAAYQQGIIYFKRGDYQDALRRFEAHIGKNKETEYDCPVVL